MDEIELLERVLLRLGCADTDEKLENTVDKFLAPVILKIESPNENVRTKVIEVLTHLNKRLKSRSAVQIPVEALLNFFKESKSAFSHNFAIIYIIMGFPRLSIEKQTEYASLLLASLEGKSETHQDKLLMLVLPLLGRIKMPDDPAKRRSFLGLENKPKTTEQLISLLMDVLLLPYGVTQEGEIPAGFSAYSFKRVISNNWKAEELEELKKGIVRFVCSGIFKDLDTFILLVLGSSDTRFSVATLAIAELSKVCTTLDFTDPLITAPLYLLFTGNGSNLPDRKTSQCSARARQKLLQYLIRCRGKGINTVKGIQVIFESLFGDNTNQKCKVLALQFCENLVKDGPIELISRVAKVILTGLQKLIGRESTEHINVQIGAYSAMARLTLTCPEVVNQDLKIVVSYFNHLSTAPAELHTSIREALVSMAPAFAWTEKNAVTNVNGSPISQKSYTFQLTSQQNLLLAMLSDNAESKLQIVQNVTSVFLTTCFPEYFAPARYLLLLIAGENSSLREAVMSYLYGVPKKDLVNYNYLSSIDFPRETGSDFNKLQWEQKSVILPSFKEMVNHVHIMYKKRLVSSSVQKTVIGGKTIPFKWNVYEEILDYLRLCLWYSAGIKSPPGDTKNIKKLREYILHNYENKEDNEIYRYLILVRTSVEAKRDTTNMVCLYDLLNAAPNVLAKDQMDLKESLALSFKDVSEIIRLNVSQIYGLLMAYGLNEDEFNSELTVLLKSLPQKSIENQHGLILVIGHAISNKIASLTKEEKKLLNFSKWKEFELGIEIIVKMLFESQNLLVSSAVKSIMLIGKLITIPNSEISVLQENISSHSDKYDKPEIPNTEILIPTKHIIFEVVSYLLKHSNTRHNVREDAARCLGYLAIGDGEYFTKRNLEKFVSLAKINKDAVLNIAISQAICCCLTGYDVMIETESTNSKNPYCDDETFDWFLKQVIKMAADINPHSRQSCSVWLLAIVKHCSLNPNLLSKKHILQYAFTELLSDESEFVQDVASRGLGLVYQLSNPNDQNQLANSLLDQLIGGKRHVNQLNPETEIFPEGFLGKTPTGGNITTYKELCGLASDLNQPDMIYQFMQLANHNATWTSKLGAAFGLKSISKDAKEKMKPYLRKIIPRLYRYKYDPTPKIQNSMISIWDSVVSDSKATVELYYWEILNEILTNLTVNEWRVRISCCLAVRDLLKRPNGLRLKSEENKNSCQSDSMEVDGEVAEPELKELWLQLFRVMDDIHEGTRIAAEGTAYTLSKICVLAASSNHGKSGIAVSSTVLPLLLEIGVTHTVPEVRKISITTISELIESSGPLVKPHLPVLIPCLLKATGELETKKLSYLSTRLGADTDAQEVVDSIRAEAAKSHHTMDTITKCIRFIEYSELETMTPTIIELMKTTVNLGTKIACAHFVCLVTIRLGQDMQPVVGKYLSGCFSQLKDRNSTVRKYFASAIGHLIGLAKEQSVKNLFQKLDDFYTENQSNKGIPLVVQAINKRQHDLLKDYWENVLPLIFFAMHEEPNEENKENIELWKELWIEIAPGNAGISMNLSTIVPKLKKFLEDPSWNKKAQSGNAINTIATNLGSELDYANRIDLIQILLTTLQGRTFDGKERLLEALGSLCVTIPKDDEIVDKIVDSALREARKEEPLYKTKALKSLALILEVLEADRFEEVYQMVWHILDKKSLNEEEKSTDGEHLPIAVDERNKRATVLNQLKETVCETLGKSWPKNSVETQYKYQVQLAERCSQCLRENTRQVQVSLLVALEKYLERLIILEDITSTSVEKKPKVDPERDVIVEKILTEVLNALSYVSTLPFTGLKKQSLSIYMILIKKLEGKSNAQHITMVRKSFEDNLCSYQKDHAPEVKCRIKDVEANLKKFIL